MAEGPVRCFQNMKLNSRSITNFLRPVVDVKFLVNLVPEIDANRPTACMNCEVSAGSWGSLKIHGHGCRERTLWGPPEAQDAEPTLVTVILRRFRCLVCGHVMTIRRPLVARYFRYSTAAIALALWLWATVLVTASQVRLEISPAQLLVATERKRWRSLRRWTRRASMLFRLPDGLHGHGDREVAARVVSLLIPRAPPELSDRARVFVGAQLI